MEGEVAPHKLLTPGAHIHALFTPGVYRPADIIVVRPRGGVEPTGAADDDQQGADMEYFVHFSETDKRTDRWISIGDIDLNRLRQRDDRRASAAADKKRKRHSTGAAAAAQKRRRDEAVPAADGADAASPTAQQVLEIPVPTDTASQMHALEEAASVRNIDTISLGPHQIDTWYYSPAEVFLSRFRFMNPLEVQWKEGDPVWPMDALHMNRELHPGNPRRAVPMNVHICEWCLRFLDSAETLHQRHAPQCLMRHPPGIEIYRSPCQSIALFEVDGALEAEYCENVSLLSKLFLEHKYVFFDVSAFRFYCLCEYDPGRGWRFVGYFSREKASEAGFNLSCIMTLPSQQQKGYGRLLIAMSYELSKLEGAVGTPERPLSDLGQRSYHAYWRDTILQFMQEVMSSRPDTLSVHDIMCATGCRADDIVSTLRAIGVLKYSKPQPGCGVHEPGPEFFRITEALEEDHRLRMEKHAASKRPSVASSRVKWQSPLLFPPVPVPSRIQKGPLALLEPQ